MRLSLSFKFATAMSAIFLALAALVSFLTFRELRGAAFEQKEALADALNYTFETLLGQDALPSLQRVVENDATTRDVRSIRIIARDRTVLASSERWDIGRKSDSPLVHEILNQPVPARATRTVGRALVILQPLRGSHFLGGPGGDIAGVAEMAVDLDAVEGEARAAALKVLAINLGGYIALSLMLVLVTRALVTRPVSSLARTAQRFREGDRKLRSGIRRTDEIGVLSAAFDDMAGDVEALLSGLEDQVAERTADLAAERQLLELLFAVTATANEAASVEPAMHAALTRICAVMRWPLGRVVLTAKDGPADLSGQSIWYDAEAERYGPGSAAMDVLGASAEAGLVSRALETSRPAALSADGAKSQRRARGLVPVLAFPILIGAETAAVMEVFSREPRAPDPRFVQAMAHVGTQLGRVIERRRMEQMKNDFISTVSHELRTPLTAIRGSLGVLAGGVFGELPESVREMIDISMESSARLVRLVNDILDIERLAAGSMVFHIESLPLAPLLRSSIEANRSYAEKFRVTLEVEDRAPGAVVAVDSDRLLQVLTNLLSNASKFSPAGERVSVLAVRRDGKVRVEVADRGPGIPDDFRPHIFHRFSQADSSTTRHKDGTGLGLSICKGIVERLGGEIGFVSQAGAGTTFYFELPEVGQ
jgi:signal transduction histidine kinase/HAMP domain-containing protein